MEPIETLMSEHRLIERVLDSLESYGDAVGRGDQVDQRQLRDFVAFIRGYADAIHHGKEEDILFAVLLQHGVPEEFGPVIANVRREHDSARLLTDDLASASRRPEPWRADERSRIARTARDYVQLLRKHITEEDDSVFVEAQEYLPDEAMKAVAEAFERFDIAHRAEAQSLREIADRLSAG